MACELPFTGTTCACYEALSDLEKKAQAKSANNPLSDLDCSAYNADIHLIEQQKNL